MNGHAGAMIVELRRGAHAKGAAPFMRPSMHETGETVAWVRDSEPARVGGEELMRAVGKLAVASLLKSNYPGAGSRHEGALVIGGVLARVGWSADDIGHVVEVVARAVGDDEVSDRVTTAAGAGEVKAKGNDVAGFERLHTMWGEEVADTLVHWLKARELRTDKGVGIAASTEIYMQRKTPLASNVGNALIALEREPELVNAFAFDEM